MLRSSSCVVSFVYIKLVDICMLKDVLNNYQNSFFPPVFQVKPVLREFTKEVYFLLTGEKNESKKVFNSSNFPVDI